MGSLAAIAACGVFALGAREAAAADTYGAIAFSKETGASGYGNRYPSRDGAEERALQECGPGCDVVMWVRNECAALVIGKDNGYGTNRGTDENEAVQGVIAQCEQYTTDCGQIVMTCSAY